MAYKIPLFNLNFDDREAQAAYDTIMSGWICRWYWIRW